MGLSAKVVLKCSIIYNYKTLNKIYYNRINNYISSKPSYNLMINTTKEPSDSPTVIPSQKNTSPTMT